MDQTNQIKARYAKAIEDGRKIEAFTSLPEWQWYLENVIYPTLDEYVERILTGVIESDKEDWMLRGMIAGIKLVVESPEGFKDTAVTAKKKSIEYEKFLAEDFRNEP